MHEKKKVPRWVIVALIILVAVIVVMLLPIFPNPPQRLPEPFLIDTPMP